MAMYKEIKQGKHTDRYTYTRTAAHINVYMHTYTCSQNDYCEMILY